MAITDMSIGIDKSPLDKMVTTEARIRRAQIRIPASTATATTTTTAAASIASGEPGILVPLKVVH